MTFFLLDNADIESTSSNFCMACNNALKQHLIWLCSAAHNFDRNTILQSIIAFLVTFKDKKEPVMNQALKAVHVDFVNDTYIQCISSSL